MFFPFDIKLAWVTEEVVNETEKKLRDEKPVGKKDAADENKKSPTSTNEAEEMERDDKILFFFHPKIPNGSFGDLDLLRRWDGAASSSRKEINKALKICFRNSLMLLDMHPQGSLLQLSTASNWSLHYLSASSSHCSFSFLGIRSANWKG